MPDAAWDESDPAAPPLTVIEAAKRKLCRVCRQPASGEMSPQKDEYAHAACLLRAQEAEVRRLRAQLPDGMGHCTIAFKECEKGHGWLAATNWVQHGCPTCEIDRLRECNRLGAEFVERWGCETVASAAEVKRLRFEADYVREVLLEANPLTFGAGGTLADDSLPLRDVATQAAQKLHHVRGLFSEVGAEALRFFVENERLLDAIRQHRDERGDDRCHADDGRLYAVLPEGDTRPERETAVTIENCTAYIACRQTGREYVSPQRRIEELEAEAARRGLENARLRAYLTAIAEDGCEHGAPPCAESGASFKHWCHPCQARRWLQEAPADA